MSKKSTVSTARETRAGYAFLSPFFILFGIFGLAPIIFTGVVAFYQWDLLGTPTYVGFQNFIDLFQDNRFYQSLGNTFAIFLFSSVPQLVSALALALVLNRPTLKFRTFWRAVVLFPFVTSTVAVALVFGAMFADHNGVFNWLLGLVQLNPVAWHADTLPGWIAIATMVNWRWTGYNALIYLAALQSIPKELYEAADVDGASKWSQFVHITIPQLRPTIFFTIVTSTIGGMQIFVEPFQFGGGYSGGSSGQFSTVTLYMFREAFGDMKIGYASAIGIALFLIIAVIAGINFLVSSKLVKGDD